MLTGPLKYFDISANLSEIIKNFGMTIAMGNSAINPIMYCWLREDFRHAFNSLLCSCCFKKVLIGKLRDSIEREITMEITTRM